MSWPYGVCKCGHEEEYHASVGYKSEDDDIQRGECNKCECMWYMAYNPKILADDRKDD